MSWIDWLALGLGVGAAILVALRLAMLAFRDIAAEISRFL